jgi:hypothetical protein
MTRRDADVTTLRRIAHADQAAEAKADAVASADALVAYHQRLIAGGIRPKHAADLLDTFQAVQLGLTGPPSGGLVGFLEGWDA